MKKAMLFVVALFLVTGALAQVNGEVRWFGDKKAVRVWGSHQERGYALGQLLGEQTLLLFNEYILGELMGGSAATYGSVRNMYLANYTAEDKYVTECQALLDGAADSGLSLYNETLARNLDVNDILMINAVIDISALSRDLDPSRFGCATLTSWGNATAYDPTLQGEIVTTRFMDWSTSAFLRNNPVIIIQLPDEENENAWASFTYPGLLGALSAVDESGNFCFLNMGNVHSITQPGPYYAQLLSLRSGLEGWDYNEDSVHDINDIISSVEDHPRVPGTIVTLIPGHLEGADPCVVESNNANGVSVRTLADNTVVPGTNLVATNHFRTLYEPVYCYRYDAIVDSLEADSLMTLDRCPSLLAGAAGVYWNLMAIRYDTATHTIGYATTTSDEYAYEGNYTQLTFDDLFGEWVSAGDITTPAADHLNLHAWPNPFNPQTTVSFSVSAPCRATVDVYDVRGRHVAQVFCGNVQAGMHNLAWNAEGLASGVYLARVQAAGQTATTKMLLLK